MGKICLLVLLLPLCVGAQSPDSLREEVVYLFQEAWQIGEDQPYQAIAISKRALALADSIHYRGAVVAAWSYLGIFLTTAGDYRQADEYLKQAVEARLEMGDYTGAAADYDRRGVAHRELGDYEAAINYGLECLTLLKEHSESPPGATPYANLALAFAQNDDYEDAKRSYHQAIAAAHEQQDSSNLHRIHHNLALLYYDHARTDSACVHLDQALNYLSLREFKRSEALLYDLLASIQITDGDYQAALQNFAYCITLNGTMEAAEHELFNNYLGIARVRLAQQRYPKALDALGTAASILPLVDRMDSREELYRLYAQVYEQTGNQTAAYQYFKRAEAVEDSIINLEKEQSILNARRRFAERGEQIAKQQAIIAEQEAAAASARSRLLGTYLLITLLVGGLIALLLNQARLKKARELSVVQQETDEKIIRNNRRTRKSLSMKLHDHVARPLTHIKRVLEPVLQEVSYDEELEQRLVQAIGIADNTYGISREISYELRPERVAWVDMIKMHVAGIEHLRTDIKIPELTEQDFSPEDGMKVSTIVGNILANVEQHAQATHVSLFIERQDGQLHLSVTDDGIGFDPVQQQGVGLSSIEHHVMELGGKLHVDSSPGNGTQIDIQIPLA